MLSLTPQPDLQQDCLDKLGRVLDLVLKTAEAAGAENNHKMVIQSAREVTRIVALIHKMTGSTAKSGRSDTKAGALCALAGKPSPRPEPATGNRAAAGPKGQTEPDSEDLLKTYLEVLHPPGDPDYWDDAPGNFFQKFSNNRELQALEKEAVAFLRDTDKKSATPS